jgi:hypothetical protein
MPYTGSQAQSGALTVLAINTGTVQTPVYTTVGEITDLNQTGKANKTDDTTNLNSTAEEFIPTLLSPGGFNVTLNRVPGDAGQTAVLASFNGKTVVLYKITLQKSATQTTTGDSYAFSALVEEWNDLGSVKADKKIATQGKLKVSGPITFTAGT